MGEGWGGVGCRGEVGEKGVSGEIDFILLSLYYVYVGLASGVPWFGVVRVLLCMRSFSMNLFYFHLSSN